MNVHMTNMYVVATKDRSESLSRSLSK